MIVTQGSPSYSPISGTKILAVTNTESEHFLHTADGTFYFLAAGRWSRAKTLEGPWSAATLDLPGDVYVDKDGNIYKREPRLRSPLILKERQSLLSRTSEAWSLTEECASDGSTTRV